MSKTSSSKTQQLAWTPDDFIFYENLGNGKFGYVYRAKEKRTDKEVAIKLINKNIITQYDMLNQLKSEIEIHTRLIHPSIIRMYAYFYDNKFVYIVYEKANGGNLFELIKSGHHFSNEELAKIFAEITRGLIYLKKRNIIHRDLKLENILVHQEEDQLTHQIEYHIKITDFGCSCQYFNKKPTTICGTAEYLAPEICNYKPYDFAIDTWALGVIMYELISGHSPFSSGDNKITMEKIKAYNDFSSLSGHLVEKKVDKSFIEMMRKILEKDLSKRIQIEDVLTEKWMRDNLQENK